jgi:hypothetical protein
MVIFAGDFFPSACRDVVQLGQPPIACNADAALLTRVRTWSISW